MRSWWIKAGALALGLVLQPTGASGHAQYRMFSTNRYLEIAFTGDGLSFAYDVTAGDLPAQKLRQQADADGNGVLSEQETSDLLTWMRGLLSGGLLVRLDGQVRAADPGPGSLELGASEVRLASPMRFHFRFSLPCAIGQHELVILDRTSIPAVEQTEVLVADRDGILFHRFWEQGDPPGPVRVLFDLRPGEPAAAPKPAGGTLVDDSGPLKRALADERLGLWGTLLVLGFAFLLGAVHALSPGHGKTLVAAYLVGTRGTVGHAVTLGLVVTFTHIFSVVILGLVALWASREVLPERLAPWLSLAAGVLVLAMGAWMVAARIRGRGHHHHVHNHDHVHNPDHEHDHDHEPDPDHGHDHDAGLPGEKVKWLELLLLGISGGMVPCLSATVVLLFAVYLGKVLLGLVLIAAFSLGLAATLILLGILVVRGRRLLVRWSAGWRGRRILSVLPLASAAAVTVIGLVMTLVAVRSL